MKDGGGRRGAAGGSGQLGRAGQRSGDLGGVSSVTSISLIFPPDVLKGEIWNAEMEMSEKLPSCQRKYLDL